MKKFLFTLYIPVCFILLAGVTGCRPKTGSTTNTGTEPQRPSSLLEVPKMLSPTNGAKAESPVLKVGDEIAAYNMSWQKRDPEQVVNHMKSALQVMLGKESADFKDESLIKGVKGDRAGKWTRIENSPVLIRYDQAYDEIRFIHEEREAMYRGKDIGEAGIQKMAESYLAQLGQRGVIDSRLYAKPVIQLGYKIIGEGNTADKRVNPGQIAEYRITFRPTLNGIEMANTGVRMGLLVTGELANMRVGGAIPKGEWKNDFLEPGKRDLMRKVQITTGELMTRFYNEKLKAGEVEIAYSKLMYAMPDNNTGEAVVEPRLVISYTDQREIDGQIVSSRRKTVAYSLTNAREAVMEYDAPEITHEGTQPTRK